jgi:hypothetical protein
LTKLAGPRNVPLSRHERGDAFCSVNTQRFIDGAKRFWSVNGDAVGMKESNTNGIYSFHVGGTNVGMAEGSVRFLADSTDFKTLVKIRGFEWG